MSLPKIKLFAYIPNLLTCGNVASGCYAAILALSGNYLGALIMIMVAAAFDFFDGLAARLLHAYSPIGKDLDSLADMVSFGVAPAFMLFCFMDQLQSSINWSTPLMGKLFLLPPFVIPIFSALRLAKFNQDSRQTTSFIGLPVPAHALFWSALIIALVPHVDALDATQLISINETVIPRITLALLLGLTLGVLSTSWLLVSEIPMFSLKVNSLKWRGNELRYILLLATILSLTFLGIAGISVSIACYLLLSLFSKKN